MIGWIGGLHERSLLCCCSPPWQLVPQASLLLSFAAAHRGRQCTFRYRCYCLYRRDWQYHTAVVAAAARARRGRRGRRAVTRRRECPPRPPVVHVSQTRQSRPSFPTQNRSCGAIPVSCRPQRERPRIDQRTPVTCALFSIITESFSKKVSPNHKLSRIYCVILENSRQYRVINQSAPSMPTSPSARAPPIRYPSGWPSYAPGRLCDTQPWPRAAGLCERGRSCAPRSPQLVVAFDGKNLPHAAPRVVVRCAFVAWPSFSRFSHRRRVLRRSRLASRQAWEG